MGSDMSGILTIAILGAGAIYAMQNHLLDGLMDQVSGLMKGGGGGAVPAADAGGGGGDAAAPDAGAGCDCGAAAPAATGGAASPMDNAAGMGSKASKTSKKQANMGMGEPSAFNPYSAYEGVTDAFDGLGYYGSEDEDPYFWAYASKKSKSTKSKSSSKSSKGSKADAGGGAAPDAGAAAPDAAAAPDCSAQCGGGAVGGAPDAAPAADAGGDKASGKSSKSSKSSGSKSKKSGYATIGSAMAADAYGLGNEATPVISMRAYVVNNRFARDSNPITNTVFPNNRRMGQYVVSNLAGVK